MSLPSAPGRGRKPPLPAGSYTTSVRTTGRLVSNGRFGYFCGAVAAAARPEQNYGIALRSAMYLQTLSEGSVAYACSGN